MAPPDLNGLAHEEFLAISIASETDAARLTFSLA
jgi:hypothetical protein